jgi:acyl-[acyl-carrier-protein]-phospholipid O-acyltransferase/long-chain-fatty-acid--[acyl-carrier-protein] ligase
VGPTASILLASVWETVLDYAWVWSAVLLVLAIVVGIFHYFFFVRVPLWLLRHSFYRLRVYGLENIPATGPALLVSNHVSWIDALVILAAQRRRIRFIIWAPFLGVPLLRLILRLCRVIPIDSRSGPRAIIQSLRVASDALAQGEVVCIFAEGGITRTGFLLPFQRGFEQIVKRCPVPIIPVCVDHVWGSIFSYQGGAFFWKLPKDIPYVVHINFGTPLPPTADASAVRQASQLLSAESSIRRTPERKPVHRRFVRMAVRHPRRACLIDPSNPAVQIATYGRVLAAVKITMRRLRPILGDDAMVGLWLPPSAGGAVANIALACLGKTSVNLNYTSAPGIIQSAIRQCNIRRVLTSRIATHKLPLDPGPGVELVYIEDFRKQIGRWERIRTMAGIWLLPGWVHEYWLMGLGKHSVSDLATVIFSSGSTGDPKGVMLTHGNIAANAESMIQAIDPAPHDRLLAVLPFFHSFGYTVTLWLPLQVGASVVYHVNPLQAREIGELCKNYQCTIFVATPTFLRSYLRRCDAGDFASLRILVCGAEKMPPSLAKEFKDKFGVLPLEGYGCTELAPVATVNVPDWEQGSQRQVGNKPGTIGHPIPGVAARIIHRETREPLTPNTEGLLLIYGANVMQGYLGREDLTEKKVVSGWYITGDLAKMDEDGFITITGREERFAKVGGEMVPMEKVEEELHHILGTNDKLCAVTAIPDRAKGERLVVLHLPLPEMSPQDLWKRLNERGLPNIYVPGQRDFVQVPELPILGSGKLDLRKCKERAMELVGNGAG